MVHKGTSSSYRSVDCIRLWSCLIYLSIIRAPLYLRSSWCYIHSNFFCLHPFLYLLVSWALCDWIMRLPEREKVWGHVRSFRYNTLTWQTDRRTDGRRTPHDSKDRVLMHSVVRQRSCTGEKSELLHTRSKNFFAQYSALCRFMVVRLVETHVVYYRATLCIARPMQYAVYVSPSVCQVRVLYTYPQTLTVWWARYSFFFRTEHYCSFATVTSGGGVECRRSMKNRDLWPKAEYIVLSTASTSFRAVLTMWTFAWQSRRDPDIYPRDIFPGHPPGHFPLQGDFSSLFTRCRWFLPSITAIRRSQFSS